MPKKLHLPSILFATVLLCALPNHTEIVVAAPQSSSGIDADANACGPPKLLKVRNACGIVIDAVGKPTEGARLQLVSVDGKKVTTAVTSQTDGQWFLNDAPQGKFLLSVWADGHNSLNWPLQIQDRPKDHKCSQPLTVHLAGALGWGCVDLTSKK